MINVIRINTVDELMPIFLQEKYQPEIGRYRSSYLYRGMSNAAYKMTTSLRRNCGSRQRMLESAILKNFTKYASIEDPSLKDSVWRQMMAGQHHGLPTRLLDFTHSPLIALHFAAVNNIDMFEDVDCAVWKIDMSELHDMLPMTYKGAIRESMTKVYSMDMLDKAVQTIEQYDEDMSDRSMLIVEPSSLDERIVNQYSFFAIVPNGIDDIEAFLSTYTHNTTKYIISSKLRWRIADTLDAFNISERIIYPGLDGLSAWIARHYYVREDNNR